jgi:hypothetical protein
MKSFLRGDRQKRSPRRNAVALETENERLRIYRVRPARGESIAHHTHAAGWVEVIVSGSNSAPGSSSWRAAGSANSLTASDAPLEIVELEPK